MNAAVVLIAVIVAGVVFVIVFDDNHKGVLPTASSLYGAFTTLIGTAIAAYFGISATRDVSNRAADNSAAAAQAAGENSTRLGALQAKLDAARSALPATDPNAHPVVEQMRRILGS